MPKSMFKNYDNHINKKTYTEPLFYDDYRRKLDNCTCVQKIYDIKGNELGIQAKMNSTFTLYFNLNGSAGCHTIEEFINSGILTFEILNTKSHKVLFSSELVDCFCNDCIAVTMHINENGNLTCGTYNMKLKLTIPMLGGEPEIYTLFSEADGCLRIV